LGLRYVFVQSVVEVSGELAAFGRYKTVNSLQIAGVAGSGNVRARSLGLVAGLSAERELIQGLALRLTMRLARASVESDTTRGQDSLGVSLDTDTTSSNVALIAEPSLALYFYF
jgi:hypothetical protein